MMKEKVLMYWEDFKKDWKKHLVYVGIGAVLGLLFLCG